MSTWASLIPLGCMAVLWLGAGAACRYRESRLRAARWRARWCTNRPEDEKGSR